jgi:flagellar hook protein FlgE
MSISALGAGLSGLYANQQALDVEGHNVANLNTAGFKPQKANFSESNPAGAGVSLSVEGRSLAASEGTDLAGSITNSLMYKAGFDMSAKVVEMAYQRMGTLIDISA